MCRFKSGLIFKDRVELAPMYNESHSTMLNRLGIKDDIMGASKVFVRAELIPKSDLMSDIETWKFVVDQDITPDWYDANPQKYEAMFRCEVEKWRDKNIVVICGKPCTKLKEENGKVYYHTCYSIFDSAYGENNNYSVSEIRKKLLENDFTKELMEKHKDKLCLVTMDLTSLDGLKDYGCCEDLIGIPDIKLYMECRENIFVGDEWWWLSTPDSTPSGYGDSGVQCVRGCGLVGYDGCGWGRCVRPFFAFNL